jgi:hypothetical protein
MTVEMLKDFLNAAEADPKLYSMTLEELRACYAPNTDDSANRSDADLGVTAQTVKEAARSGPNI